MTCVVDLFSRHSRAGFYGAPSIGRKPQVSCGVGWLAGIVLAATAVMLFATDYRRTVRIETERIRYLGFFPAGRSSRLSKTGGNPAATHAFAARENRLKEEDASISPMMTTAGTRNSTPKLENTRPAPRLITIGVRNWITSLLS